MAEQNHELKDVLSRIEREIGKGTIMRLDEHAVADVPGISTGALSLDIALGGKGLPRGRIIEIFGPEASGKTTVALHAVANAQKQGGVAAFIDAEHALDPGWAKRLGVDLEGLLVSQPSCAEEALKIAEMLIKSNAVDIIVIDSVAALVPRAEIEGEIGDTHVGIQARLMSQALRILTPAVSRLQDLPGLHQPDPPEDRRHVRQSGDHLRRPGPQVLRSRAGSKSARRRRSRTAMRPSAPRSRPRWSRTRSRRPSARPIFDLMHDGGISREGDLINLALEDKLIDKSGAWLNYGEVRLGQGKENAKEFLRGNPALVDEISRKVLEKRGLAGLVDSSAGIEVAAGGEEEPAKPEPAARRGRQPAASNNGSE